MGCIAPHTAPAVSFRASDRRHWRGNPFPAPAGAELLASLCEAAQCSHWVVRRSVAEVARSAGGRDVDPPHPRCSSVGGDAHAVERSGTSTLGVHRPAVFASYSGRTEPSAPTTVYRTCALSLPCHSEPVTDVTGVGIRSPRPQARNSPPPSARDVARSAGGRDVDPPHPRCPSVGGDAHIAPYAAAAPRHQASLV